MYKISCLEPATPILKIAEYRYYLDDRTLSLEAKGAFASFVAAMFRPYVPDKVCQEMLSTICNDEIEAVNELENKGYIKREETDSNTTIKLIFKQ